MSSLRNTKRKRSKAGAPATSSTRERAVAPEPAHGATAANHTGEPSSGSASVAPSTSIAAVSTAMVSGSDSSIKAIDDIRTEGIASELRSTEKKATKNEENDTETISNTGINGKSTETDKLAADKATSDRNLNSTLDSSRSIDASSSCSSSQDGTSTRRQALHIANDDDDREKHMKDLISHRSVLLERVRACRASAEKRIGENSEGNNNTIINANDLSDSQEIAEFRTMTKQANQVARKNRETEGVSEKRTSLSLRRGSSVGKRMNAALSSLVPGSNVAGSAGGGANNPAAGQTTTTTLGKSSSVNNPHSNNSKSDIKGSSPPFTKYATTKSSGRLPINNLSNDSSPTTSIQTPATCIKSNVDSKSNKAYPHLPSQSTKQSDAPTRGRPPNSKNARMKMGAAQAGTASVQQSLNTQNLKKNAVLPLLARSSTAVTSTANPHSLSAKKEPKVNFPEAILLREKRDQIQLKLRKLMEERQNGMSMLAGSAKILPSSVVEGENNRRKTAPGGIAVTKPPSNKKMFHPPVNNSTGCNGNGIPPPALLPNRRRTHWDTVLQEMSWLASDFIEERKWKLSTSRLLSSKIPQHGLSDRRKRSSDVVSRGNSDNTPRDYPSDETKKNGTISSSDTTTDNSITAGVKISKKKFARRKYTNPATDDETLAKCRSRIVSCMISKLDVALIQGGSLELSDKYHEDALNHFIASRSDIIRNAKNCEHSITLNDNSAKSTVKGTGSFGKTNDGRKDTSSRKAQNFDTVDDFLDHCHSICKSKHKLAAKETAKALKYGKTKLSSKQKEMLEFVDKLWTGKPHSGAVILGSLTSGMTFGTATIIWKQRSKGFQILICSSRSLIRWKYELNRFSGIRVLIFGSTGGISNPDGDNDIAEIQSTDVILCEYTSVSRMKTALNKLGVSPFSVVVDLRHFVGLRKSLRVPTSKSRTELPLELLSTSWWGDIANLVKSREARCLFLEYYDSDPLSLSNSGVGQKEQISILAKRAACIIGPGIFDTNSHSLERQVIAWARRKGKHGMDDKASRVKKVLYDALYPMCFRVTKPIVPNFDFKWELRSCKMSTDQRQEYERCCSEVRGALSSTIEESNANGNHYSVQVISNALIRLRNQCFYSRKQLTQSYSGFCDEYLTMTNRQHGVFWVAKRKDTKYGVNSSQPDADKAYSIIQSSSKLKELVSILLSEGGYNLNFDESLKKTFGLLTGTKKGKDEKRREKKIVILASLPNIQHIVSALLNSLGIQNELLYRYEPLVKHENSNEANFHSPENNLEEQEAVAWAKCQSILSRFCCDKQSRKTNIIIASPAALTGRNDGIGIEGADMIITLDSDWSRRDGFVMNSLVRRWYARNKLVGKEDKLIRLVCSESIESKIFRDDENDNGILSWPLDSDGFFTLPISQDQALLLCRQLTEEASPPYCSFPAVEVLQNRGSSLKDVLASSSRLPLLFGSGKPAKFLPKSLEKASIDEETIAELHFLKCFLREEKLGLGASELNALAKSNASPLLSTGLTSRKDMPVIESRLFLERLLKSNSPLNNFEDHSASHALHSNVLFSDVAQAQGESQAPKIDENPALLLFYEPNQQLLSNSEVSRAKFVDSKVQNSQKRRYNTYAKLFSSSWNGVAVRDGNQGCEPLVFFPPLFPLLKEVSKKARIQYTSSTRTSTDIQGTHLSSPNENNPVLKRKDREFVAAQSDAKHDSKRPKIQSLNESEMNGYPAPVSSFARDTNERPSLQDVPDSRIKLLGQNGKTQTCAASSETGSNSIKPNSSGPIEVGDDFGLLGSGAFPTPIDAISFSAHDAKLNGSYVSTWNRPDYGLYQVPCDAEETSTSSLKHMDDGMESVLLFVKKRPRSKQATYKPSQGLSSFSPLAVGSKAGDESGKKIKKRGSQVNSQVSTTAFTRLPSNFNTQHSQVLPRGSLANPRHVKGDYRHKLLASVYARQRATGMTLFDSFPYRAAAMRVERRVTERLEKLMWKSSMSLDANLGLPIQLAEKLYTVDRSQSDRPVLTSVVKQVRDGLPLDDITRTQSNVQKLELKGSSVSPRCVDFGSFEVGYLGLPSGMTGTPTSRLRVGVSLPMGVKVMQPTKDQKKRYTWNIKEDKILQDAAKKFGMNWQFIASVTSGFEHVVINGNLSAVEKLFPSVPKSARQCRDRLEVLSQCKTSLVNEARRTEFLFRQTAADDSKVSDEKGTSSVCSAGSINILCRSDDFLEFTEKDEVTSDTDMRNANEKDTTKALTIANEKSSESASPRSTVDKKDDVTTNENNLSQVVTENSSEQVAAEVDSTAPDVFEATKLKRRSFSAISIARSRRQIFPVTIPGIDVGGNQAGHPVPSHPSHMQSVQISVAAQWASGRTEMWPLQILDLADKQRSGAARINIQRGDIPTVHNPSRRHPTGSSSYQHRSQPSSQSSTVRASVGYSPQLNATNRPVAPRTVNAPITPHHQHRSPPVTAATVQAYIPPQTAGTGKQKKSDKQKPSNKASPK